MALFAFVQDGAVLNIITANAASDFPDIESLLFPADASVEIGSTRNNDGTYSAPAPNPTPTPSVRIQDQINALVNVLISNGVLTTDQVSSDPALATLPVITNPTPLPPVKLPPV